MALAGRTTGRCAPPERLDSYDAAMRGRPFQPRLARVRTRAGGVLFAGVAGLCVLGGCDDTSGSKGVTYGPPANWIRTARPDQLYILQCAQCHGSVEIINDRVTVSLAHRRALVVGPWLRVAPAPGESEAQAIANVILNGVEGTEMIGFRRGLSDAKALELAQYILDLRAKAAQNIADGPPRSADDAEADAPQPD